MSTLSGHCREIRFTGRVQGVGFRATTSHIARGYAVTGWVRNEADGSVTVVVEGEAGEIDRFLSSVRERMAGLIEAEHPVTRPATGEFSRFEVRR
jgi:acylphosphatase